MWYKIGICNNDLVSSEEIIVAPKEMKKIGEFLAWTSKNPSINFGDGIVYQRKDIKKIDIEIMSDSEYKKYKEKKKDDNNV
ncbi:hypothetical protein D2A34_14380 [Clostridium chromiireducens]|uniref:Uncharacterized protein n=1 Tax=Clostridium chromiireducens TaxID=225345 RepID=A0A399IMJ0_9CLOT|nr:hypothetical protein [Clostridium chromiireducens]RII34328.1 hypothetical protein D2A34_14380 [Clostridium chromiireducens]